MLEKRAVSLHELVLCFARATDLVSPLVAHHHEQVAYVSTALARQVGLPAGEQSALLLAALLHDAGALSLGERMEALKFEFDFTNPDRDKHAALGWQLLSRIGPLRDAAEIVRYHHAFWKKDDGSKPDADVPHASHILHLADRVAILVPQRTSGLAFVKQIGEKIKAHSGELLAPELVEVFLDLASKESFWFGLMGVAKEPVADESQSRLFMELNSENLVDIATAFGHFVDFRCRFTATHSAGVAASARMLAGLAGFSGMECQMMYVAGQLHDLGKLAVPPEIISKPGKLTQEEFDLVKAHPYHTHTVLGQLDAFYPINLWAALHHECPNGRGYPFHATVESLSLGARIMAVADRFAALTEHRPYRAGMSPAEALGILGDMATRGDVDPMVVRWADSNRDALLATCKSAQAEATRGYEQFGRSWR